MQFQHFEEHLVRFLVPAHVTQHEAQAHAGADVSRLVAQSLAVGVGGVGEAAFPFELLAAEERVELHVEG